MLQTPIMHAFIVPYTRKTGTIHMACTSVVSLHRWKASPVLPHQLRTIDSIKKCSDAVDKKRLGVLYSPLINIDVLQV